MFNFDTQLDGFKEFGVVEEIYHPVVMVSGLPNVRPGEMVVFENNSLGKVLHIGEELIEVLYFSRKPVLAGIRVTRTNQQVTVRAGEWMLGNVLDPMGKPMQNINSAQTTTQEILIDKPPLSISTRTQITEPLISGVTLVDVLLPLGKGQRELVVGDRKSGKTSFLLNLIKTQVQLGSVVIYAAIGKQLIEIETVHSWLKTHQVFDQTIIVGASSNESQSMIYMAPFTAMSIAEFFKELGREVIVVLDDLTNHAKYYREISLLAKRFPGRDSYPGDIFYTHARLLERAGNYLHKTQGTVPISCLPVAETTENDLSDYIVSNLIGITDGHILFDSMEFVKGRRPAINPMNSVTRVGRQTQSLLHQDISQKLTAFLTEYEKHQRLSHFGTELSEKVKETLDKGNKLYQIFNQPPSVSVPLSIQIVICAFVWGNSLTEIESKISLAEIRQLLIDAYFSKEDARSYIDELMNVPNFLELVDKISANRQKIWSLCEINKQ